MRWRKIAFWSVFGLFSLLVLLVSWLWVADLGVFKPQLERFVREQTGREFAIDGTFTVDLAGHSRVVAENVRLGNADWAGDEDMLTVARVEVVIDLWSLFGKRIRLEMIDVDGADVHLARRSDGPPNWDFAVDRPAPAPDPGAEPLDFLMRQIEIDDLKLHFDDPDRTEPLLLNLSSGRQSHRDDDILEVTLDATLNDRVIAIDGELGPWNALIAGKDIRFDINAVVDTLEIGSQGFIDNLVDPHRPTLDFHATGPDIDDVTRMLGIGESGEGDIDLTGSLLPQDGGPVVLDIEGNIGATEVKASGEFSDLQNLEQIDIDVVASGPDLSRILRIFGIHQVRESPFMIDIGARRDGSSLSVDRANMIFGDARFEATAALPNFPRIDDSRVDLKVEGPDIEHFRYVTGLPGAAKGPFSLSFSATPAADGVDILDLDIQTALGHLVADGRLTEGPSYYGSTFTFDISTDSLERMGSAYGVAGLPVTPLQIKGAAEWTSRGIETLDDVIATVDDVTARVDGVIVAAAGIVGSDLNFRISGDSLAGLMEAFASGAGVPDRRYDIQGRLQVSQDGYRFRGVDGSVGTSTVKIDGLLARNPLRGSRFDFVVEGPAFEELIGHIGSFEVRPGDYTLSGRVGLQPDLLSVEGLQLNRERGRLSADIGLGLPASRKQLNFRISGRGRDIRDAFAGYGGVELNPQEWALDTAGELRGRQLGMERLEIDVGQARLRAAGELDFAEGDTSTQFNFSAEVPSLAALGKRDGYPMRDMPLSILAQVEGGDRVLRIDGLQARLGTSDVRGEIRYALGNVPELSVDIRSDAVIIPPLAEERPVEYDPEPEFDDGRLIPDIPLPLEAMKKLNARIAVDIGTFERDDLRIRNLRVRADLRDQVLNVSEAGFDALRGRLDARLYVSPVDDRASVHLQLEARDFAPGLVALNRGTDVSSAINIDLHGTGNGLRTILADTSGVFFMDVRGGRVPNNRFVQALYGDLLNEIVSTINPFYQRDPYTEFECIVLPIRFTKGVAGGDPYTYIETGKIRINLKSNINFGTEKIDINVRTTPRQALGISAGELLNPYIKIVGTMAKPRLAVDEEGVLLSGGAAVATGGLSVLARAAWDRVSKTGDECEKTAEAGRAALGALFPALNPARSSSE